MRRLWRWWPREYSLVLTWLHGRKSACVKPISLPSLLLCKQNIGLSYGFGMKGIQKLNQHGFMVRCLQLSQRPRESLPRYSCGHVLDTCEALDIHKMTLNSYIEGVFCRASIRDVYFIATVHLSLSSGDTLIAPSQSLHHHPLYHMVVKAHISVCHRNLQLPHSHQPSISNYRPKDIKNISVRRTHTTSYCSGGSGREAPYSTPIDAWLSHWWRQFAARDGGVSIQISSYPHIITNPNQ